MSGPKRAPERPAAAAVDLPAWLGRQLSTLSAGNERDAWLVAFSGGADSLALLAALQRWRLSRPARLRVPLRALHVDHGLNPRSAAWARDCRRLCATLAVPLTVRRARLAPARGVSVEAAAREARYALLRAALRPGELLLTAHHLDDQLETILLQLMRGAGVSGLAGMPARAAFGRGWHLRPLLSLERGAIAAWVQGTGLAWIDDDSNADERFDRNYLRRHVLPLLQSRWPAAARVAARSAAHLAEARELLAAVAEADLGSLQCGRSLDAVALAALPAPRQRNAVRAWIVAQGLPVPDTRHLARILGELCDARRDARPLVAWPGVEVRRHRARLYAIPPARVVAAPAGDAPAGDAPAARDWHWARGRALALAPGCGSLVLVRDPSGPLAGARLPASLQLRFRDGGERLRLAPGGPRRTLKELLREAGVLPWMRPRLPLLYAGDVLVAVADLFVAAEFQAAAGERLRLRLHWQDGPATRADRHDGADQSGGISATPDRQ